MADKFIKFKLTPFTTKENVFTEFLKQEFHSCWADRKRKADSALTCVSCPEFFLCDTTIKRE